MLTLFVDASFSSQRMKAGYGAWAIHDSWNRGYSFGGQLFGVRSSSQAELVAIAKAVEHLQSRGRWIKDVTMIQSDSHHALSALLHMPDTRMNNAKNHSVDFSRKRPSLTPLEENAIMVIRGATSGFQTHLRHVKGHSTGKEGRNWVNSLCDRIARKHMRAA